jgi:two-component system, sensor histidine kinase and response regulator
MMFGQIQLDPSAPWGTRAEVFDPSELLCRLGDDRQAVVEVVELFLDDYRSMMRDIRDALANRDAAKLEDGAHKLLGTIAHFATSSAYESARRMEEMGRVNDMDGAARTIAILDRNLERLAAALNEYVSPGAPS